MDFQTFYPKDNTLKKHIDYYYFFSSNSPSFRSDYYSFPNITTPINIHKHVNVYIKDDFVRISQSKRPGYSIIVNQVRQSPLLVEWKGKLDKVTIVFKPLGLNSFINKSFIETVYGVSQLFTAWNDDPGLYPFLDKFYATGENIERVAILEKYLLSRYYTFKEQYELEKAIDLLCNFERELKVNDVAASLGLTVRTFDRLFQKHTGISPVQFRKIARFRHSLKNKLFKEKFMKLTEIGYESNFYDQSYFIKVYNNLTGNNPTTFFKTIEKLGDDQLIFRFLNR